MIKIIYGYLLLLANHLMDYNGKLVVEKLFTAAQRAQASSNMETLSCCDDLFYLNLTVYLNRPQLTLEHLRSRLSKIAHEIIEVTEFPRIVSAEIILF
jgi:hypothetical protein